MTQKVLIVVQTLILRQAVLMPVVTAGLAGVYHIVKPKALATPDFDKLANSVFVVLGTLASILGGLHDSSVKAQQENKAAIADTNATASVAANVAAVAASKLTEVADVVNTNAGQLDQVTPPAMTAAKVDTPIVVVPIPPEPPKETP